MAGGTPGRTQHIEITANLGRQAFEALYLELRRLAKRHGAEIQEFRVERVAGPRAEADKAAAPEDDLG
jgi:hypothetical protein